MYLKKKYNSTILFTILILLFFASNAQEKEVKKKKDFKNTISTNLSNPAILSSKFLTLGYERVLKNNQSFSLSIGVFGLPEFSGSYIDSLNLQTDHKDKGFHFAADYRFYLKKENKHVAPRGVYIGPYYSYNFLNRKNNWQLNTSDFQGNVGTDLDISINTIGFELGYQFVFWDRLALDLILLGPGVGFYGIDTKLDTNLSPEDESLFFDKINDALADKIPGYGTIISPGEFSRKGSFKTTTWGYRYLINIGFRF